MTGREHFIARGLNFIFQQNLLKRLAYSKELFLHQFAFWLKLLLLFSSGAPLWETIRECLQYKFIIISF